MSTENYKTDDFFINALYNQATNNINYINSTDNILPENLNIKFGSNPTFWKLIEPSLKDNIKETSARGKGAFFILNKLDKEKSKSLASILEDPSSKNSEIYFDKYGNFWVLEKDSALDSYQTVIEILNPLINLGKDTEASSNLNFKDSLKPDYVKNKFFILNKNKQYILYREDINTEPIFYLLYNPIHRVSFKNLYENNLTSIERNGFDPNVGDKMIKYCEMSDPIKGKIDSDNYKERTYGDAFCTLMDDYQCIKNAWGDTIDDDTLNSNRILYTAFDRPCSCINKKFETNRISSSSLFYDNLWQNNVLKVRGQTCPTDFNVQACIISTGKNASKVNITNSTFNQDCKMNTATPTSTQTSTQTSTSTSTSTPSTSTPSTSTTSTSTTSTSTTSTPTTSTPTTSTPTTSTPTTSTTSSFFEIILSNNIFLFLFCFGIILLLFFIVFSIKKLYKIFFP